MGKKYIDLTAGTDTITKPRNIAVAAPYDVRTVVETYDDLFDKNTFGYSSIYIGMMVITADTQDVYILSTLPGQRDTAAKWAQNIKWKKIGGEGGSQDLSEYAKKEDLVDFLTSSDLDEYVKADDIADLVSESDLDVYVKTEDIADFVKESDLGDYAKKEDLVDFLTASDVDDFVRLDELNEILDEELADRFVAQSDLDLYVKAEDIKDFVTSSEFEARLAAIKIPENVSAFNNDAGYITKNDLPDFLTASDVEDFVKVEDLEDYIPKSELENLAAKSDLEGYVKTEDAVDYLTSSDLDEYVKLAELPDFLMASDLDEYVKVEDLENYIPKSELEELASKSDLEGYVRTEDAIYFLTGSDLDGYVKEVDIPKNVSAFINDAGYLTDVDLPDFLMESDLDGYVKVEDLEDYIPKSELDELASKSDLDGYVKTEDAIEFLTDSDLDEYAKLEDVPTEGSFPDGSDIEDEEASVDGYATVQDVMDYVNALLEKKKEPDYFYINAIRYTGTENPTSIYQMNCYEIGDEVELNTYNPSYTGTGFAMEVKADAEIYGFYEPTDPSVTVYSEVLTIDIPDGYTLEVHGCDESGNYYIATEPMMVNFKGATRQYGSKIYNSYARSIADPYGEGRDIIVGSARYLIILKKTN